MNFFFSAALLPLWGLVLCEDSTKDTSKVGLLLQGAKTALTSVATAVDEGIKNAPIIGKLFPDCFEPPLVCPNENVTFWYYTRDTVDNPHKLDPYDPKTLDINGNNYPWKVIIHGYTKSKDEIPNPQLRSAYFKRGNYNLISVDYEPLARDKCYVQAVHNVPLVAKCTAEMIDALLDRDLTRSEDLHVIGFSLGGQIAGQIYEYMKHEKPKRVTGLDPAAPLFDGVINDKLTKDSGKFVDVIHTNGMFNGKIETSGHVDFFVNGGLNQPGCAENKTVSYVSCSHNRSPLYYAESINSPEGFWGIPCSGYLNVLSGNCEADDSELIIMGEYVPQDAAGTYYLPTSSEPPFALGKVGRKSDTVST